MGDGPVSTREEQIAAIREAIDWLEAHPEVPMPVNLDDSLYATEYGGFAFHIDAKATLAAMARALPGKVEKEAHSNGQFYLTGRVAGIRMHAIATRSEVCERVVTGTREVTKTIPDPAVVVPVIEVTETVEDVEWVCGPLLKAVGS